MTVESASEYQRKVSLLRLDTHFLEGEWTQERDHVAPNFSLDTGFPRLSKDPLMPSPS